MRRQQNYDGNKTMTRNKQYFDSNDKKEEEDAKQQQPPTAFDTSPYETRGLNAGDVIQVHYNQDDNETVLTDLQTIEYIVGGRNLFPAAQDISSSDSDDDEHPLLNPVFEEDGRSSFTPPANPVPFAPDHGFNLPAREKKAGTKNVPSAPDFDSKLSAMEKNIVSKNVADPDWKGQLDAEIRALPSRIPSAPPQIKNLWYDDQGRAYKEQLKNNWDAVARVGAHAQPGTATPGSTWKEEFVAEINPLPTTVRRVAAAQNIEYNDRWRATKQNVLNDATTASGIRALAQGGPAPFDTRARHPERGTSGEFNKDIESNDSWRAAEETPIQVSEATIPSSAPLWQWKPFLAAVVVLLVVVVVAVVVPLVGSGGEEEGPTVETDAPTEYIAPIPNLSNSTLVEIETPGTIPNNAYNFVIRDPNWNSYEDWRRQQRFAMACVFYAFGGYLTGKRTQDVGPTLYALHECEWASSSSNRCPDDDGIIKILILYNSLDGKRHLPPEVELLPDLQVLEVTRCVLVNFEQLLPLDVPNSLASLSVLRIVDSDLAGSIPSTLSLLTSLTMLDLTKNNLVSTIPSELGLLSNMTSLILSENDLSGTIPEELGNLTQLEVFEIEDNSEVEALLPSGFCLENHTAWTRMATDWCSNPNACCAGS
jgi:hypothetical protein